MEGREDEGYIEETSTMSIERSERKQCNFTSISSGRYATIVKLSPIFPPLTRSRVISVLVAKIPATMKSIRRKTDKEKTSHIKKKNADEILAARRWRRRHNAIRGDA